MYFKTYSKLILKLQIIRMIASTPCSCSTRHCHSDVAAAVYSSFLKWATGPCAGLCVPVCPSPQAPELLDLKTGCLTLPDIASTEADGQISKRAA